LEYSLAVSYIDELESQIGLLDETIASLQLRRADLLQSVKVHRAALSPIRRLPPEILGEIFSLVVRATFHSYTVEQTPLTQHAPWLFTRVCRHWSAVALSNSALWSTILRDHDRTEENPGALPLTKLCLERSGNVPLNVTIFQEMGVSDPHLVVFDTVLASSARWGRVKLHVLSGFSWTYALLQQLTNHRGFSALTTLLMSVEMSLPPGLSFDDGFWNVFAVVPQLRTLQAHCWDQHHLIRPPFSLPWHQLTRVSATFTTNTEALSVFRNLSNIVQCWLIFVENELLPTHHSTIRLPHLRSLALQIRIEFGDGGPVEALEKHTSLLDFLETPCLHSLTTDGTADEEAVLGLITRSDCSASLASFHFRSSIHHDSLLDLLQRMPHLTSLKLENFDGTLLPRPSVPVFVQAFSSQWLDTAREIPLDHRQALHVRIVDEQWDEQDACDMTRQLVSNQEHGLFITVSAIPDFLDIFCADFD
jgi:hypothetical protein